jgi:hypothetical protein
MKLLTLSDPAERLRYECRWKGIREAEAVQFVRDIPSPEPRNHRFTRLIKTWTPTLQTRKASPNGCSGPRIEANIELRIQNVNLNSTLCTRKGRSCLGMIRKSIRDLKRHPIATERDVLYRLLSLVLKDECLAAKIERNSELSRMARNPGRRIYCIKNQGKRLLQSRLLAVRNVLPNA